MRILILCCITALYFSCGERKSEKTARILLYQTNQVVEGDIEFLAIQTEKTYQLNPRKTQPYYDRMHRALKVKNWFLNQLTTSVSPLAIHSLVSDALDSLLSVYPDYIDLLEKGHNSYDFVQKEDLNNGTLHLDSSMAKYIVNLNVCYLLKYINVNIWGGCNWYLTEAEARVENKNDSSFLWVELGNRSESSSLVLLMDSLQSDQLTKIGDSTLHFQYKNYYGPFLLSDRTLNKGTLKGRFKIMLEDGRLSYGFPFETRWSNE